jgi:hypothetical protein
MEKERKKSIERGGGGTKNERKDMFLDWLSYC